MADHRFLAPIITAVTLLGGCASVNAQPQSPAPSSRSDDPEWLTPADRIPFDAFDGLTFDQSVPDPASHLGYEIGAHFTRHADVVSYLDALAAASDRVQVERYGLSHQRRPLMILTISDPANLEDLDGILERNRTLADPATPEGRAAEIVAGNPTVVWFSYNVHGNEPSPTECAIQLAYTLAAATNPEVRAILREAIVVIDPVLNPDGRERYVSWFQGTLGRTPIDDPAAAEHDEPWPGGRTNHYLFDLNRDWIWLTQPESQQRMEVYRRYLPQLHVDFHEQGYTNPYFLGAGDEPYHPNIAEETREWVERYGVANAEDFDRHGLLYSTKERFDYLYPGYGKVMPVYHGAVGMLAEKAGHGRAGLTIRVSDIYDLTLQERADHHFLLSISNLRFSVEARREQLERFRRFFDPEAIDAELDARAFFLPPDNDPVRLRKVFDLCMRQGVVVEVLDETTVLEGLVEYRRGETVSSVELPAGTWVVRTDQPMGRLAATLFERESGPVDPDTYDITSWSVPIAFGLTAYASPGTVDAPMTPLLDWSPPPARITGTGGLALIVDSRQHRFPLAVGLVRRHDISARYSSEDFTIEGRPFAAGSLIVHAVRNDPEALEAFVDSLAAAEISGQRVGSGLTDAGPVLAANANRSLVPPRPILLRGRPLSSNSYGQIWHLLDVESPLPNTPVNVGSLRKVDLDDYNLLIIPHVGGDLETALGADTVERIDEWIRAGHALVAVGGASSWASRRILDISGSTPAADKRSKPSELTYRQRRDRSVEDRVPGTSLRVSIDTSHPLAAGLPEWIGVLKQGTRTLPVGDNGYVVASFDEDPRIGGTISDRNAERLSGKALLTHHRHGRGVVICLGEDVTFRGFQHGPMRMLLNAVIYGPSLP